jgi:hypothetical protein
MKEQLKATYDVRGIGITELMLLGLNHPIMYEVVTWFINHDMPLLGLRIARMTV